MRYGSVCSGIEAASVAWHPLGWKPAWFSEIEKFPSSVLAHHWPDVPNLGDMTKFKEWPNDPIQLLVGGTPCQSFSVAGLRKGLDDPRGNLMLTYIAIAGRFRPRWVVWENVPGVLSSNEGRDFGSLLSGLGQLGYGFAWAVRDAQYVRVDGLERAVPQRRRRVFVVGYLGDWRRAASVLFDAESLRGNTPPRRHARQGIAGTVTSRTCRSVGAQDAECGHLIQTLDRQSAGEYGEEPVASTVSARDYKSATDLVAHVPDVAGTMKSCAQSGGFSNGADHAATGYMIPVSVFDPNQVTSKTNRSIPTPDLSHTLPATMNAPVCFSSKDYGADALDDLSPTLRAGGHNGSHANAGIPPAVAFPHSAVRRLMPVECERLQGFPDGHTQVTYRGKPAADGPRYKAIGNSMAVNCMRWIGRRIQWVEDEFPL